MQHRTLGRTGAQVSLYALGTTRLSARPAERTTSMAMVARAVSAGIDLVDTSDTDAETERLVGQALQGHRDQVVLATTARLPRRADRRGWRTGIGRQVRVAVEGALRRLDTDYLDVLQVRPADPRAEVEETLVALSALVRSGKVLAVGTTDVPVADVEAAQGVARRRGLERYETERSRYSVIDRRVERDLLATAEHHRLGVLVSDPMAGGLLAGHEVGTGTTGDRARQQAVRELHELAGAAGLSLTHLAMAFATAHPAVSAAVLSPRSPGQLEHLIDGMEVRLDADLLDRIDAVVPPGTDLGGTDPVSTPPVGRAAPHGRRPVLSPAAA